MCVYMYYSTSVEDRRQLVRPVSLLPPLGSQGLTSGCQVGSKHPCPWSHLTDQNNSWEKVALCSVICEEPLCRGVNWFAQGSWRSTGGAWKKSQIQICEHSLGLPGACAFGRREVNRSTLIHSAERWWVRLSVDCLTVTQFTSQSWSCANKIILENSEDREEKCAHHLLFSNPVP